MKNLNIKQVESYVNKNIVQFHKNKIKALQGIDLKKVLLKKNPYLFKAKNITLASDLINNLLDATLSSSEEKIFGDFLEDLAIFVASKTCKGRKSTTKGIDLSFDYKNTRHLISVKSGSNWGNSSSTKRQEEDFKDAVKVVKQSSLTRNVQPVLGICYGKVKTAYWRGIAIKVVGQNFWYYISENERLYTDIIQPIGYEAKKHNLNFEKEKGRITNNLTAQFLKEYCVNGVIDWRKVVEFNSGNLDLK